jgi:hypothetical protein
MSVTIKPAKVTIITAVLAFILLASREAHALPTANPDSSDSSQTTQIPHGATKDGFSSTMYFTEDLDFQKKFHEGGNIILNGTTKVWVNVPFLVIITFSGPGMSSNGDAKITIDIKITKPDGTTYFEAKDVPGWDGKYRYSERSMQLADAVIKMRIEPTDPLGKYTVNATVRDSVKGVNLALVKAFDAKK